MQIFYNGVECEQTCKYCQATFLGKLMVYLPNLNRLACMVCMSILYLNKNIPQQLSPEVIFGCSVNGQNFYFNGEKILYPTTNDWIFGLINRLISNLGEVIPTTNPLTSLEPLIFDGENVPTRLMRRLDPIFLNKEFTNETRRHVYDMTSCRNEISKHIPNKYLKQFAKAYITFLIVRQQNNVMNEYENSKIVEMVDLYGDLQIEENFHINFKNVKRISKFLFIYFAYYFKYIEPYNLDIIFSNLHLGSEILYNNNLTPMSNFPEKNPLGILFGIENYTNSIVNISLSQETTTLTLPISKEMEKRKILLNT